MARPRLKRALKILAGLIGALVLALVVAVLYLQSSAGRERVRARVEERVNERIFGRASLGAIDYALFGHVQLEKLTIEDATGRDAVTLDALEIVPAWGALLTGHLVVRDVRLTGVHVVVVQNADGTSNLSTLARPEPPAPTTAPKKPPSERAIRVDHIGVSNVRADVTKPDGATIAVSNVGLEATLALVTGQQTVRASVKNVTADVAVRRPDGLALDVTGLRTGLDADVTRGSGDVKLGATHVVLAFSRPDQPRREVPIDLAGVTVGLEPGKIDATLKQLGLVVATLASVELRASVQDGNLVGDQAGDVLGLHVEAAKLNELIGKDVLASDVDVETSVKGQPKALVLNGRVRTNGGTLGLSGTIDVERLDKPTYDLTLTGDDIATARLLKANPEKPPPPIGVQSLRVHLVGTGARRDDVDADADVEVKNVTVGNVPVDSLTLAAHLDHGKLTIRSLVARALGQDLTASGAVVLSEKHVDLTLRTRPKPAAAVAALRKANVALPPKAAPLAQIGFASDLDVHVSGDLDGQLHATVEPTTVAIAGGTVTLAADVDLVKPPPTPGEEPKKLAVSSLAARVTVNRVRLGSLAALRGKKLEGVDGTISGTVIATGTPQAPSARFELGADVRATNGTPAHVRAEGHLRPDRLEAHVRADEEGKGTLLTADVSAPLAGRGLAPNGALAVKVDVPRRSIADFVALKPVGTKVGPRVPEGEVEAHVDLHGSAAKPDGTFAIDLLAWLVDGSDAQQRVRVDGRLTDAQVGADLGVWLDATKEKALTARVGAELGQSPLRGGARDLRGWSLVADLAPQSLAALPLPQEAKAKLAGLAGSIGLHVDARGTRDDATGAVALDLKDVQRGGVGPIDAHLEAELDDAGVASHLAVDVVHLPAVRGDVHVDLPGKGLLLAAREHTVGERNLNADVELVRHPLADWSALRANLKDVPGEGSGKIEVRGTTKLPLVDAQLLYDRFPTHAGVPGQVKIAVGATPDELTADVVVGTREPLAIAVRAPRKGLLEGIGNPSATLPVHATVTAKGAKLATLVPSFAVKTKGLKVEGDVDADLDARVDVALFPLRKRIAKADLDGGLHVAHGTIGLPNTSRTYHDVTLDLDATSEGLRLSHLSLRESDPQKKERSLDVDGQITLEDLEPTRLELDLHAKDWLVFGGSFGKIDAPRGALTLEGTVRGELAGDRNIDVGFSSLELAAPDRFLRAHHQEDLSLGDVVFLDDPGAKLGKLPPPPKDADAKGAEKQGDAPPAGEPPATDHPPTGDTEPPPPGRKTRIHIALPDRAHIWQSPLNLYVNGAIDVVLANGERQLQGELTVVDGTFYTLGKFHQLDHGTIRFDAEHPKGYLDLDFKRPVDPIVARDLSLPSSEDANVHVMLKGPPTKPELSLRGAGNAWIVDATSVENAGKPRYYSEPDLPPSSTAQAPQINNVLTLTYLSVNLPHQLFLDGAAVWSDPDDLREPHGRARRLEATHTARSGNSRIQVTAQPPTTGESTTAIEWDYLIGNTRRTVYGAGVRAGSRLGGGPGIFWEWSSEE